MTPRSLRLAKLGLLLVVVAALVLAYRLGAFAVATSPRTLARALLAMGARGYLAFIAAYTLLQPFGVPGTVFIVAAPLIWPWKTAFVLSLIGTMAASVVGFSFARFVARDFVSARIPGRFRKYDAALEQHAFRTVFLLRLIFWMPQVLHTFLGVSKVRFWTHFWGSFLGYLPPLLLVSYLGSEIFDDGGHVQLRALWRFDIPEGVTLLAGLLVCSLLLTLALRRLDRRRAQKSARERSS